MPATLIGGLVKMVKSHQINNKTTTASTIIMAENLALVPDLEQQDSNEDE